MFHTYSFNLFGGFISSFFKISILFFFIILFSFFFFYHLFFLFHVFLLSHSAAHHHKLRYERGGFINLFYFLLFFIQLLVHKFVFSYSNLIFCFNILHFFRFFRLNDFPLTCLSLTVFFYPHFLLLQLFFHFNCSQLLYSKYSVIKLIIFYLFFTGLVLFSVYSHFLFKCFFYSYSFKLDSNTLPYYLIYNVEVCVIICGYIISTSTFENK